MKLLLKHGADVDHDDYQQRTPLMHATICGFPHIIRVLAKHGADVDAADIVRSRCWHRWLLSRVSTAPAAPHGWPPLQGGCTPLMIAAEQQGHLDTVELLIEEGAEVNAQSKVRHPPPLAAARCARALAHADAPGLDVDTIDASHAQRSMRGGTKAYQGGCCSEWEEQSRVDAAAACRMERPLAVSRATTAVAVVDTAELTPSCDATESRRISSKPGQWPRTSPRGRRNARVLLAVVLAVVSAVALLPRRQARRPRQPPKCHNHAKHGRH